MFLEEVDEGLLKDLKKEFNNSVFLILRNEVAYETYKNLCTLIPNVNLHIQEFIEFPERVIKFKNTLYEFQNGVKPLGGGAIKTSEGFLIYSMIGAEKIKEVESVEPLEYNSENSPETLEMLSKIVQDYPEHFV